MALTGTLKDFGIAEILQLIGTQKKTGVLTLEDNKHKAVIEFADGMIVNGSGGVVGLLPETRLVKSEYITQEQLNDAKRKAQETLKPFTAILVAENIMPANDLRAVITQHVAEIVYETFAWKTGTYAFEQQYVQWDKQFISPMSAESIMMDGLRIVDESPGVFKIVTSFTDVYSRTNIDHRSRDISPDMERILALVDGKRTAMDVILKSRMARFDALKLTAKLVTEELIAKVAVDSKKETKRSSGSKELTKPALYALYAFVAILGVVAVFRIGMVLAGSLNLTTASVSNNGWDMFAKARETRLVNAVEAFKALKGSYPESLDALAETGLLTRSEIDALASAGVAYKKDGAGYKLDRTPVEGGVFNP